MPERCILKTLHDVRPYAAGCVDGSRVKCRDTMKQRKPFLLRLHPAVYDALDRWAQQDMRSVNGQIEYLLRQAVSKHFGAGLASAESQPTLEEGPRPA
jgi:hypothetical protein